ncbi:MAG: hypothetical protein KBT20_10185 [Bacteroidales bacterium]|nr:hypothetical protein [Candidatus Liminaster caballi]
MIADISQVYLYSKFFAELIKADSPINELKDGVVYVKANNDANWNAAVSKVKESFANCSMRGSWLMKYDIDVLPEDLYQNNDSFVSNLLGTENNIIMPVFLPDRMEQYYFVGAVTNIENLEPAASFLSIDVQKLIEACLPYALSQMEENKLEELSKGIYEETIHNAWADEIKRINAGMKAGPSFRALDSGHPLTMLGDDAVKEAERIKKGNVAYVERRKYIKNLPSAIKKLRNDDEKVIKEGKKEYAQAYESLSEHERVLIFMALFENVKNKTINNILNIIDREKLASQTKYSIVFQPWEAKYSKDYNLKDYYKKCLFIADGTNIYPVKMSKSSMVVYTLSLIEKVTKNKKNAIVDIEANNKAFIDTYKILFNDYNENTTQKMYVQLFKRNTDTPVAPIRSGRLSENYKDIEAALAETFQNLDEDYLPFLANSTTPLAIDASKIALPSELKTIKIH